MSTINVPRSKPIDPSGEMNREWRLYFQNLLKSNIISGPGVVVSAAPVGVTISGSGSGSATPGTYGSANQTLSITIDGLGQLSAVSATSIAIAASQITSGALPAARFPALTGDITTVAGALATTLATVNSTVGAFGAADKTLTATVDAKGRTTVMAATSIAIAASQITSGALPAARFPALTGDITTVAGALATTLATVNSTVGTFGSASAVPVITVNGKGLATAVSTAALGTMAVQNANAVAVTGGTIDGATVGATTPSSVKSTTLTSTGGRADVSYSYQTPTTGFSITIAAGVYTLILEPAGALATGTITMPAAPGDGQVIRITSTQNIVALTVSPNSGQSIKNAPTGFTVNLTGNQGYEFIYRVTNTTWYRLQ